MSLIEEAEFLVFHFFFSPQFKWDRIYLFHWVSSAGEVGSWLFYWFYVAGLRRFCQLFLPAPPFSDCPLGKPRQWHTLGGDVISSLLLVLRMAMAGHKCCSHPGQATTIREGRLFTYYMNIHNEKSSGNISILEVFLPENFSSLKNLIGMSHHLVISCSHIVES